MTRRLEPFQAVLSTDTNMSFKYTESRKVAPEGMGISEPKPPLPQYAESFEQASKAQAFQRASQVTGPTIEACFHQAIRELATQKVHQAMSPVITDPAFNANMLNQMAEQLKKGAAGMLSMWNQQLNPICPYPLPPLSPFKESYVSQNRNNNVVGGTLIEAASPETPRFTTKDYVLLAMGGLVLLQIAGKLPAWLTYLRKQFPTVYAALDAKFGWLIPAFLSTEVKA